MKRIITTFLTIAILSLLIIPSISHADFTIYSGDNYSIDSTADRMYNSITNTYSNDVSFAMHFHGLNKANIAINSFKIYTNTQASQLSGNATASVSYTGNATYNAYQWTGYMWYGGYSRENIFSTWNITDGYNSTNNHYLLFSPNSTKDIIKITPFSITGSAPDNSTNFATSWSDKTFTGDGAANISFMAHSTYGIKNAIFLVDGNNNLSANVMGPTSAVPLPPSVYLFGSGLVGLVGLRRFRRS